MKTKKILLAAGVMLIAGAIFYSCQKEQTTQPVKEQGTMTLKDTYAGVDCNTACLQAGPYEQTTTSYTRQWAEVPQFPGYWKNNKYFIVNAWHDQDYFYIKSDVFGYQYNQHQEGTGSNKHWVLDGPTFNNYPFTAVIITLNGTTYTYAMDDPATIGVIETATTYTQAYALPDEWTRCSEMVYTVRLEGDGAPVWLGTYNTPASVIYNLFGICTTTDLEVSPSTTVCVGSPVTLTATVSSDYDFTGGTINIYEGTTNVASAAVSSDPEVYSVSFSYTPSTAGTRTFVAKYDGTGSNGYNPSESGIIIVTAEDCGCDESFSYYPDPDNANTYIFTFIPSEILTDKLVVFTFAQSDMVDVTGDVSVSTGWTIHGQTYQKTMSFNKCESISWQVTLTPKCQGNSGINNLWTDFKVGDVSKKNVYTPNITVNCSN